MAKQYNRADKTERAMTAIAEYGQVRTNGSSIWETLLVLEEWVGSSC